MRVVPKIIIGPDRKHRKLWDNTKKIVDWLISRVLTSAITRDFYVKSTVIKKMIAKNEARISRLYVLSCQKLGYSNRVYKIKPDWKNCFRSGYFSKLIELLRQNLLKTTKVRHRKNFLTNEKKNNSNFWKTHHLNHPTYTHAHGLSQVCYGITILTWYSFS